MSKLGFIYFKLDTNRYQDIKIKRLKKSCKGIGVSVHDYILTEIYRGKGYFIEWDDNLVFDVAEYWGIGEEEVKNIVDACLEIGLFHMAKYTGYGILTSRAIQERYVEWSKQAKRTGVFLTEEYRVFPEETIKLPEELTPTTEFPEEIDIVEYSIVEDSKGEESKVTDSIEDNLSDAPSAPTDKISINKWIEGFDARKVIFQESLYPFTKKPPKYNGSYPPEMVKKFFDYWSEPNKSRSKMKWETEKTWELALRLSRWANSPINNNLNNQNKSTNVHQTALPAAKSGFHTLPGGK